MTEKEIILDAYKKAGLEIDKIRALPAGGFYVYHPFASSYKRRSSRLIKKEGSKSLYEITTKQIYADYICNESIDTLQVYLVMAITEAKVRKGKN